MMLVFNWITSICDVKSLQLWAMLMAVSCLSPVSTHTTMPASRSLAITSGTPSCNRSSIPVAPTSLILFSNRLYESASNLSRFSRAFSAL